MSDALVGRRDCGSCYVRLRKYSSIVIPFMARRGTKIHLMIIYARTRIPRMYALVHARARVWGHRPTTRDTVCRGSPAGTSNPNSTTSTTRNSRATTATSGDVIPCCEYRCSYSWRLAHVACNSLLAHTSICYSRVACICGQS